MKADWQLLTPILVHIQAHLEDDLQLRTLAARAGVSPFHFHRLFRDAVGETPKAYVTRLRLERAAFRLTFHESTLLEMALGCGFRNHETFTRAFRRHFSCTPEEYRSRAARPAEWWAEQGRRILEDPARGFDLSATRVVTLRPTYLAFLRHIGPYESVPESLFDELDQWAMRNRIPRPLVWLGMGHDSPATTAPAQLRFDAALRVEAPFAGDGRIACQKFEGGAFAMTEHAGSYDTLPAAYRAIFARCLKLAGYQLVGLPVLEVYHTTRVDTRHAMNHTSVYLRVAGPV